MKDRMMSLLKGIRSDIDFEASTTLIDHKILSSLDIIQVISGIEEEFNIEIPVEDIKPENLNSVDAMVEMVEQLVKMK